MLTGRLDECHGSKGLLLPLYILSSCWTEQPQTTLLFEFIRIWIVGCVVPVAHNDSQRQPFQSGDGVLYRLGTLSLSGKRKHVKQNDFPFSTAETWPIGG